MVRLLVQEITKLDCLHFSVYDTRCQFHPRIQFVGCEWQRAHLQSNNVLRISFGEQPCGWVGDIVKFLCQRVIYGVLYLKCLFFRGPGLSCPCSRTRYSLNWSTYSASIISPVLGPSSANPFNFYAYTQSLLCLQVFLAASCFIVLDLWKNLLCNATYWSILITLWGFALRLIETGIRLLNTVVTTDSLISLIYWILWGQVIHTYSLVCAMILQRDFFKLKKATCPRNWGSTFTKLLLVSTLGNFICLFYDDH